MKTNILNLIFEEEIGEKKNCQNPFPAISRRKKVPMTTKPKRGGGGKGLSTTKNNNFFAAFLMTFSFLHSQKNAR